MMTLNAVVHTMLNAQVAQIWQLSRKTQQKKKLHKLVLVERKLKLSKIAEELKISEGSVFTILREHLSIKMWHCVGDSLCSCVCALVRESLCLL